MIDKISPVSVKGKANVNTKVDNKPKQNIAKPVSEPLVMKKAPQVDTFVSKKTVEETPKPKTGEGNGKLLAGVISLMEMVNIVLGSSSKK